MLLSKEKIKEALEYYYIKDIDYYEKCNRCIDETNNNKKIYDKTNFMKTRRNYIGKRFKNGSICVSRYCKTGRISCL